MPSSAPADPEALDNQKSPDDQEPLDEQDPFYSQLLHIQTLRDNLNAEHAARNESACSINPASTTEAKPLTSKARTTDDLLATQEEIELASKAVAKSRKEEDKDTTISDIPVAPGQTETAKKAKVNTISAKEAKMRKDVWELAFGKGKKK
jgi:hypothetical protein